MRMIQRTGSACGALFFLALFFCGCHANVYYQNRAAERAREFLLKEATELTMEEQNFVRYNDPVLLHSPLLEPEALKKNNLTVGSTQSQICITWKIPTRRQLYLVFGVSRPRMDDWYPNRLIRRSYYTQNDLLHSLAEQARDYAQNNLFSRLNVLEVNEIRFTSPWLMETAFELNCDPEGTMSETEKEKAREGFSGKYQYSLVWKFAGKAVVFCGVSNRYLGGWRINFAGIISLKELEENTRRVWLTPEQALEPLPPELQDPEKQNKPQPSPKTKGTPVPRKTPLPPSELRKNLSAPAKPSSAEK